MAPAPAPGTTTQSLQCGPSAAEVSTDAGTTLASIPSAREDTHTHTNTHTHTHTHIHTPSIKFWAGNGGNAIPALCPASQPPNPPTTHAHTEEATLAHRTNLVWGERRDRGWGGHVLLARLSLPVCHWCVAAVQQVLCLSPSWLCPVHLCVRGAAKARVGESWGEAGNRRRRMGSPLG